MYSNPRQFGNLHSLNKTLRHFSQFMRPFIQIPCIGVPKYLAASRFGRGIRVTMQRNKHTAFFIGSRQALIQFVSRVYSCLYFGINNVIIKTRYMYAIKPRYGSHLVGSYPIAPTLTKIILVVHRQAAMLKALALCHRVAAKINTPMPRVQNNNRRGAKVFNPVNVFG